jgi:DNA-binding MarR family transcriptional regulator
MNIKKPLENIMNDEYDTLKEELIHTLIRFKKVNAVMSHTVITADGGSLSFSELHALGCIDSCAEKDCPIKEKDCSVTERTTHHAMHETLAVSKAAISQMLASLEKRGYIRRETDTGNRRKIIITLTPKGRETVDKVKKGMDDLVSHVITQFGEEETRHLIRLLNRFEEVIDEMPEKQTREKQEKITDTRGGRRPYCLSIGGQPPNKRPKRGRGLSFFVNIA